MTDTQSQTSPNIIKLGGKPRHFTRQERKRIALIWLPTLAFVGTMVFFSFYFQHRSPSGPVAITLMIGLGICLALFVIAINLTERVNMRRYDNVAA